MDLSLVTNVNARCHDTYILLYTAFDRGEMDKAICHYPYINFTYKYNNIKLQFCIKIVGSRRTRKQKMKS